MSERCGHDHAETGLHGAALTRSLDEAEVRCAGEGERMTPQRRRVLELLLAADGPVKAYDLISRFDDGKAAKPPTVYRALEFLEKQGLAHRIESLNAYVACRLGADTHAAAFLICDCCGAASEVEPAGSDALIASAAGHGFRVDTLTMEAHGLCAACAGG